MNGPETRPSLLMRLRDPNREESWHEFSDIYRPIIYRMAQRGGLQHSDAEDLCQQVLTRVSRSIDRFESNTDRGSFRGWLHQITRNVMINMVTRDKSVRGSGDTGIHQLLYRQPDESLAPSTAFDIEHRRAVFHWAADLVKEEVGSDSWASFWNTYVEGRTIAEVARELDKREGTVRVARCRVFARIKQRVEQYEQDYDSASPS